MSFLPVRHRFDESLRKYAMKDCRWEHLFLPVILEVDISLAWQVLLKFNRLTYTLLLPSGSGASNGIGVAGFELNVSC